MPFKLSSSEPALEALGALVVASASYRAWLGQADPDEIWLMMVQGISPPVLLAEESVNVTIAVHHIAASMQRGLAQVLQVAEHPCRWRSPLSSSDAPAVPSTEV